MAVKVCLDAGHYGKYNRSPAVSSYYESDMTWKLHNYLKKELEAFGIGVRVSVDEKFWSSYKRIWGKKECAAPFW
ncbi:MAG: N-acetylmuramoyl-L-alanine amidase [Lachnospiraceae bacterium]|nr:N-acetylmuramoyl-L-alanine amidase [Lachnospiraceae bacterium]